MSCKDKSKERTPVQAGPKAWPGTQCPCYLEQVKIVAFAIIGLIGH